MTRKKILSILMLIIALFLLTGCGEQEKYDEAVAWIGTGDYAKAYQAFEKLGNYQDAKDQMKQVKQRLFDRAEESLLNGDYQQTIEDLERSGIVMSDAAEITDDYAHNALNVTYIQGLSLTDGALSCKISVADGVTDPKVSLSLTSKEGPIVGTVSSTPWDGESQPRESFFVLEDYGSGGQYIVDKASLNERNFTMVPKKVSFYDAGIFTDYTNTSLNMTMMYKAIA